MLFKEKLRNGTPPIALTADGTAGGLLTLATIEGLYVKQKINLWSNTEEAVLLEIKAFPDNGSIYVGEIGNIHTRYDCSRFTLLDNATIQADNQPRPGITEQETIRAVYQEEPAVALRTTQVDRFGNSFAGGIVNVAYDEILGTYPDGVTEVYTYLNGGVQVAEVTVVYTSGAKTLLASANVTYP